MITTGRAAAGAVAAVVLLVSGCGDKSPVAPAQTQATPPVSATPAAGATGPTDSTSPTGATGRPPAAKRHDRPGKSTSTRQTGAQGATTQGMSF
jgi:hypothetical protein